MENRNINNQTKYIIAVHNKFDKYAIQTSIEEANNYLERFPERKAIIVSGIYRNDDIAKEKYTQSMAARNKGKLKLMTFEGTPHEDVLSTILLGFKNGLIIIHEMQFNETFLEKLINYHEKNIDVIIHRNKMLFSMAEVAYFNQQSRIIQQFVDRGENYIMPRRIIVRMHNDNDFAINKEGLIRYMQEFGEKIGYKLFLCQFILLKKRHGLRRELERVCAVENEKFEDFIDPYFFEKETANYVYFEMASMDIIANADIDLIKESEKDLIRILQENEEV
jgi:hypothetical protein